MGKNVINPYKTQIWSETYSKNCLLSPLFPYHNESSSKQNHRTNLNMTTGRINPLMKDRISRAPTRRLWKIFFFYYMGKRKGTPKNIMVRVEKKSMNYLIYIPFQHLMASQLCMRERKYYKVKRNLITIIHIDWSIMKFFL